MSGLAACWHLDGSPLSPAVLAAMVGAVPHRGPDGVSQWVDRTIGLGHCLLATTPESIGERQPLIDGSLALVFDGRLDNRAELLRRLQPDPLLDHPTITDASLVAAAYRRWNTAVAEHLLGDFSFVLWDGDARRVVCARDPFGMKPLYYFHSTTRFFAGSEIGRAHV